jgi:heme exporter protein D
MPVFESIYAPYIWAVYILALIMVIGMVSGAGLKARKAKLDHEAILKMKANGK